MQRSVIAWLSSHYRIPSIYGARQYVEAGGLVSYGVRNIDGWHAMGVYAARILKGERTAMLPVQQVTATELFINKKAADAPGIPVPPALLVRADVVID